MDQVMFHAFADELCRLEKISEGMGEAVNRAILNNPELLRAGAGGAVGGLMAADPGAGIGGALTGAATAAGTEALARKYIGPGGSLAAQLVSPITGLAGGRLYSGAKQAVLPSDSA